MNPTLRVLGGATIESPDGPVTGRASQRHRLALLALLASAGPGGVARDKLAAYLWPESGPNRARRLLSDSVYRIHRALGNGIIQTVGDQLALDSNRLPSDLAAFEDALEREAWEEAAALYTGPFLDGFHLPDSLEFERWVDGERDRLAGEYARSLETLADARTRAGDLEGAVRWWRRRSLHDPFDSRVAFHLMEVLAAAGNPAGALKHARQHAVLLDEEFGADLPPGIAEFEARLRAGHLPPTPGPSRTPARAEEPEPSRPTARTHRAAVEGPTAPSRWIRHAVYLSGALLAALVVAGVIQYAGGPGVAPDADAQPGLAVLPFTDPDTASDEDWFADGLTDELLTTLSGVEGLRVLPRASILSYRDPEIPLERIARELDVRYVLTGNVRRSARETRIAVQLVDTEERRNVWAESYRRRPDDIFNVQADIASQVADALKTRLTPQLAARFTAPPTESMEAYNAYLRGRWYWHRRTGADLEESVRFFQRAIDLDPDYTDAWIGLADALAVQAFYDFVPPLEAYPRAREAAFRALELDPALPKAHASLGYITLYHDWDAKTAETHFLEAIELDPGYTVAHQWYANLLVATGRFDDADRAMERARETNPLSLIANGALGWVRYYAGRYEDALEQYELALEMDPDWELAHQWRGQALLAVGRTDEALVSLERAEERSGGSAIARAGLAHGLAIAGNEERAREILADLRGVRDGGAYVPAFELAKIHVALEEHAPALSELERALDEGSHSMVFLEVDPQLAPLRQDPGFRRLVDRVALGN
jgi:TolB-like protein/DNA-binding SARP family transcriptional activator/Flp pilus assembly protein TadD